MPSQYDTDTKFLEFLLIICLVIALFSIVFFNALSTNIQNKFVQQMYLLFMILFTLFVGAVFFIFIIWFGRYKPSFFKFR